MAMVPFFLLFPYNKRGRKDYDDDSFDMDIDADDIFMAYEKDPKDRSIVSFLLLSFLLGFLSCIICSALLTLFILDIQTTSLVVDWSMDHIWVTILMMWGLGILINTVGWIIFMIKQKKNSK